VVIPKKKTTVQNPIFNVWFKLKLKCHLINGQFVSTSNLDFLVKEWEKDMILHVSNWIIIIGFRTVSDDMHI
jgi:hypothetical protein